VNVPEFRSRFLELYHQRYLRPLRDYLIGSLEFTMPWMARVPALYNGLMRAGWVRTVLERHVGMVDSPLLSRFDLAAVIRQWQVKPADPQALAALGDAQRARSVVIVQDTFTRYFDTEQLATLIELAARMGFQVWLAPLAPNGKALHVQGFLRAFERAAIRNATQLAALARSGVALVGLDPAMTLTYRQEYLKVTGLTDVPKVALPQEWLLQALPEAGTGAGAGVVPASYRLLPHCTEKTNAPDSGKQWAQVFARRGLRLQVQATGCCGMSGTYGHEARNLATSKTIYAQSWAAHVDGPEEEGEALATGYSCRSQVKRMSSKQVRHPLQALLDHVRAVG
jgi:Fe-S oxidoreductase